MRNQIVCLADSKESRFYAEMRRVFVSLSDDLIWYIDSFLRPKPKALSLIRAVASVMPMELTYDFLGLTDRPQKIDPVALRSMLERLPALLVATGRVANVAIRYFHVSYSMKERMLENWNDLQPSGSLPRMSLRKGVDSGKRQNNCRLIYRAAGVRVYHHHNRLFNLATSYPDDCVIDMGKPRGVPQWWLLGADAWRPPAWRPPRGGFRFVNAVRAEYPQSQCGRKRRRTEVELLQS